MHSVAEAALEAVAVEQRQEELKVRLLAVVRGGRHQQEVAREPGEELAKPVALRVLDLVAEERRRHLVRLVADHEVEAAVGRLELLLHVLVARELVEPGDDEVRFEKPVAGAGGFELVVGEDLEGQMEAAVELVLPLLGEAAGANDQATLQVAARNQLLDEQARHDRLAGAGIVGQQEAQRLARKHGLVYRGDLVRQRIDHRGVDRQHRIEEVRQLDAHRLGDQAEQRAVAVEAPRPALLHEIEPQLVVPVEQLVRDLSRCSLVSQLECLGAEPLDVDHCDEGVREEAPDGCVGLKGFEFQVPTSGLRECASAVMTTWDKRDRTRESRSSIMLSQLECS